MHIQYLLPQVLLDPPTSLPTKLHIHSFSPFSCFLFLLSPLSPACVAQLLSGVGPALTMVSTLGVTPLEKTNSLPLAAVRYQ